VSARIETTLRATIPRWARAGLGLLALAGLAALAVLRPRLPTMPWQALQPTTDELVRQGVLCLVWLLLLAACLRLAWVALRPPRRVETKTYAAPNWLPEPRRARLVTERPDSRELLHLFSRPRSVSLTEIGPASEASDALESQTVEGTLEAAGDDGAAQVMVSLCGRLRVGGADGHHAGERATRGLIAYLVLKRAAATMDELVEALWPGENPVKTRQRLWKAKRQAQRLLGEALVRQHDSYEIDRKLLRTDIDELTALRGHELLGRDELERAVALTREEPLADVDYEWAESERRRLQAIQAELLERLAAACLTEGDANGALAAAERLIQFDRLNERGWCLAMEADGELGNRQGILDRYERLGRELDECLGLRPGREAQETYRRLLGQT
jgi:DNA-binding SARP family transcriptional activator